MDTHNRSLASLKADVTKVKLNAQLGENDTTAGTTNYLPKTAKSPMYVRIDWTRPVQEQMAIIGDTYKLYRPRLNQVIVGKVDKAKNSGAAGGALAFMSMSEAQLKANYRVSYLGEESISGGAKTWHLELTPINRTSYRSAELWVDSSGMPLQAKVIENNNDSTTVLLSNLQKNISIKADIFDLKLPKGVKEIKA
jgi:outer membrane lipoprotein-sorting protein